MKLYCVVSQQRQDKPQQSVEYLRQARMDRELEFIILDAETFDYSQDTSTVIEKPSLLYRVGTTRAARMLEALLLTSGIATMYREQSTALRRQFPWGDVLELRRTDLSIIPTVLNVDAHSDPLLAQYVAQLGGFPVILKASGGSHGASVLRLDSIESLRSVLGYIASDRSASFALRKFIPQATHVRLVVVGDQVVDAIRYLPQPDDFRTNAVAEPQVELYPQNVKTRQYFESAAKAVAALGLEFGGVDLLIDQNGDSYIAEVNYPCNFARNQMNTGCDVAGAIVDHLLAKVKA